MMFASQAIRRHGSAFGHDLAFGLACAVLAATVFFIDTFTEIEGAIAVLYVIATLLASQASTRLGLVAVLALVSFFYTHSSDYDLQSTIRLLVALAALLHDDAASENGDCQASSPFHERGTQGK